MSDKTYKILSSANISDTRNVVISKCDEGYTIAQQMVVNEEGKNLNFYMKGAIHVKDEQGLYNLRDCLNVAIEEISKK